MAISVFASFRTYVLSSILLTTAVVSHAVLTKRFFYRSVVHLANSKFAILAVANMALATVLLIWRLIQYIFLGPLRFRETERLHIRARDAIIECCFAISVFRDEFDEKFVALVMTLLLLKSLHWLTKDRIEFLEEQPLAPRRTHIRLVGLMLLLATLDTALVTKCVGITIAAPGRTMFVLFAFEFTLLQIELLADTLKYIFLLIDTRMDNRWDSKSLYTFYSELICDMCQLTIYLIFFIYVQIHYSFPYHIIRELYMTFHKFRRRLADFLRYRRVVATMNDLFADATEEELAEGDRTCIICREEMTAAKKLSCGHMFHARCLQSWLKRQLTCPTCRATIDVSGNPQQNRQQQNVQQNAQPDRTPNPQNLPRNPNGQRQRQPRQAQQPANLGDAGQRLLDFANHWWNQVMNDYVQAARNPRLQPILRGPNAVAHRQLRQRRRGAWPGPYQPYAPPGANQNPFAPRRQQPQQQPQQQQPQQAQEPGDANRHPPTQPSTGGPSASSNTATSTGQSSTQASSSQAPPPESSQSQSQAQGQPSSATDASSAQPSSSTQQGSSAGTADPPASETTTRLPPLRTLFPSDNPDLERIIPVYQFIGRGYRGAQAPGRQTSSGLTTTTQASNTMTTNEQPPAVQIPSTETPASQFPLARLLAIQEQIEILRSEVQALVLLATNPPPSETASDEPSASNIGTDGDAVAEVSPTERPRDQATTSSEANSAEQRQVPAAEEAPREARGENNDSEAERLRQRRIEFLERRSTAS